MSDKVKLEGSSNDELPFEPGEQVVWAGMVYVVIANHGDGTGHVRRKNDEFEHPRLWWTGRETIRRYVPPPEE
jgi:hypothetical protein